MASARPKDYVQVDNTPKSWLKTIYSDFSNASDGAGHAWRNYLNSSREAADTTLDGNLFHYLGKIR